MMNVPFANLAAQVDDETIAALVTTAFSGKYILGERVRRFEEKFSEWLYPPSADERLYAVGVSSGSDALYLALKCAGVNERHQVITTPFTFYATAAAIVRAGATPYFVDIDKDTWMISPEEINRNITPRTAAVIPVHLFGLAVDILAIKQVVDDASWGRGRPISLIEDACQAIGTEVAEGVTSKPQFVGSWGEYGCFSFFPTKTLGCLGDGGMVVTKSKFSGDLLRSLRNNGVDGADKYYHAHDGGNYRLDEIQAAVLLVRLAKLDATLRERRRIATLYMEFMQDMWGGATQDAVGMARSIGVSWSSYSQFVISCDRRDDLRVYLKTMGIETAIYYPTPLHLQPIFSNLGYKKGSFKNAEALAARALALPIYPGLTDDQVEYVVTSINDFYK